MSEQASGITGKIVIVNDNDPSAWPTFEDLALGELELHECGELMLQFTQYHVSANWRAATTWAAELRTMNKENQREFRAQRLLWSALATRYKELAKAVSRLLTQLIVQSQLENGRGGQ